MNFKTILFEPNKNEPVEFGLLDEKQVLQKFDEINWATLAQLEGSSGMDKEYYWPPSFSVFSSDQKYKLEASLFSNDGWQIYYTRPRNKKNIFGDQKISLDSSTYQIKGQQTIRSLFELFTKEDHSQLETLLKNNHIKSNHTIAYLILIAVLSFIFYGIYINFTTLFNLN